MNMSTRGRRMLTRASTSFLLAASAATWHAGPARAAAFSISPPSVGPSGTLSFTGDGCLARGFAGRVDINVAGASAFITVHHNLSTGAFSGTIELFGASIGSHTVTARCIDSLASFSYPPVSFIVTAAGPAAAPAPVAAAPAAPSTPAAAPEVAPASPAPAGATAAVPPQDDLGARRAAERDAAVVAREVERNAEIEARATQRAQELAARDAELAARDAEIAQRAVTRAAELAARDAELAEREAEIAERIRRRDAEVAAREAQLRAEGRL